MLHGGDKKTLKKRYYSVKQKNKIKHSSKKILNLKLKKIHVLKEEKKRRKGEKKKKKKRER